MEKLGNSKKTDPCEVKIDIFFLNFNIFYPTCRMKKELIVCFIPTRHSSQHFLDIASLLAPQMDVVYGLQIK